MHQFVRGSDTGHARGVLPLRRPPWPLHHGYAEALRSGAIHRALAATTLRSRCGGVLCNGRVIVCSAVWALERDADACTCGVCVRIVHACVCVVRELVCVYVCVGQLGTYVASLSLSDRKQLQAEIATAARGRGLGDDGPVHEWTRLLIRATASQWLWMADNL